MIVRFRLGFLVAGIACLALVLTPAAGAQEERQQPQDAAASGSDMLQQSGVANPAQAALFAFGSGERHLKRAEKLKAKLPELEGKKRASACSRPSSASTPRPGCSWRSSPPTSERRRRPRAT